MFRDIVVDVFEYSPAAWLDIVVWMSWLLYGLSWRDAAHAVNPDDAILRYIHSSESS